MIFYVVHSSNSLTALFKEHQAEDVGVGYIPKAIFSKTFSLIACATNANSINMPGLNNQPLSHQKQAFLYNLPVATTQWSSVSLLAILPILNMWNWPECCM